MRASKRNAEGGQANCYKLGVLCNVLSRDLEEYVLCKSTAFKLLKLIAKTCIFSYS